MSKEYLLIEDLLTDESFLAWYHRTNDCDIRSWEVWIASSDARRRLAEDAVKLLEAIREEETIVSAEQINIAERRIMAQLNMLEPAKQKYNGFFRMHRWRSVAAIVLLLASTVFVKLAFFSKAAITTNYGEMKMQLLSDGTEVMLNANSSISYHDNWKENSTRDVWIDGEAFFHVKKTKSNSAFIVHTKQFDIRVTGTKFNVMDRPDKSNVLLEEGQVILKLNGGREVIMKPGEFLEISGKSVEKKNHNIENIVAWKEKKIVFDNTPLADAIGIIREHYGVQVELDDRSLETLTLTGIMPNDNLEVLLEALNALNEFRIIKREQTITITRVQN